MPIIMFTTDEVIGTLLDRMTDLSKQVNELSELNPPMVLVETGHALARKCCP